MYKVSAQLTMSLLLVGVVFLPQIVFADEVIISEVMYSPPGPDSGHEWVEVHNRTDRSITLTDWSLRENETDHRITTDGTQALEAGSKAVIADDPDKFTSSHTSSGLVFDSTFSLNNDGEKISLKNSDGDTVDTLRYDPATGADGGGNSLQLVDSHWMAAEPTPNAENREDSINADKDESSNEEKQDSPSKIMQPRDNDTSDDNGKSQDEPVAITVDAGRDQQAIAGVQLHLKGTTTVPVDVNADDADVYWSLGNGDTKDSADIFYTYQHPGDYVATLIYQSGNRHQTDQITVEVLPPDLEIADRKLGRDGYVRIDNQLDRDVNLSGWHLRSGDKITMLPDYTIALANRVLTLNNEVTGMTGSSVQLLYPDGTVADTYQQNQPATTSTTTTPIRTDDLQITTSREQRTTTTATATDNKTSSKSQTLSSLFATGGQAASVGAAGTADGSFWQWAMLMLSLVFGSIGVVVLLNNRLQRSEQDRLNEVFDISEM